LSAVLSASSPCTRSELVGIALAVLENLVIIVAIFPPQEKKEWGSKLPQKNYKGLSVDVQNLNSISPIDFSTVQNI